ncbi:hypothetical protein [Actinophytocola xinjiangensis]|uniref:hypothetical protein n=1 Tax=Actinophytocola xinjiangensis TaxID=485602 RepID=UPI0012B70FCF|nr:hypothetical protein [Actinophytocola xinjiangensis]
MSPTEVLRNSITTLAEIHADGPIEITSIEGWHAEASLRAWESVTGAPIAVPARRTARAPPRTALTTALSCVPNRCCGSPST